MRVIDLYPMSVTPTNAWRNVEELSAREWTEAIEALGDLRDACDAAHERALEEWNRRYPRENYASSEEWTRESTGGLWTVNERGEFIRE
jgi:hypothetical protein